ncbi:type II toxin-antitoxin system RelE/ParE family toxin [Skermanella stibiiresistens]|uniref:type II toxin-antitoxin system RelE/ParE family toxin n=1 Tax=Skermanella stibiiresistens TaxID=913326 RepID=UPI001FE0CCB1|nr:type II toxin-antitoxin system RelE/ParE family toxin [Skermanella stibiiresistens]
MFKDLEFDDWARGDGVTDAMLRAVALEIEDGLVDARLGGFLIKKRIAALGRGKSGGYRTIAAYRQGDRLIFLHGFAKNEKDNITKKEKKALQNLGDEYMKHANATLERQIAEGLILEITCDEQNSRKRP